MGMVLALWIVAGAAMQVRDRLRLSAAPRAWWGMQLAHLGIAVFVVGVTIVKGFETEKDVRMESGDTVAIGQYSFRLAGVRESAGPNYTAVVGDVELVRDGRMIEVLHPEKRVYFSSSNPMTDAAIWSGWGRDLYVSLGEPLDGRIDGAWSVRVYDKPFVNWIWGGCLLMALGGLLAMSDRRYRPREARSGEPIMQGSAS
jgi:cytochrome c-type biogenesis protein CcmF